MTEKNTNFDEVIERRNTDSLKFDFAKQRGMPEDVLPLWVADMDFKTSSIVLEKIKERVEHGIFGYTETGKNYFDALQSWLYKHHNLKIEERWVVKTPGVVFAIASAIKAFTNEGDAVLIEQPVYYPFSGVIRDNKRRVVSNDLVLTDNKYHIDFDDFEKKIVENKIKLFVLCNPHNPVGRVWTKDELIKLIDICIKHDVIIFSDEIHADFVYNRKHQVLVNGVNANLTQNEYKIIGLLGKCAGKVLTYDYIIKELWGPGTKGNNQTLRVHMANIRRKIEKNPAEPRYIFTEIGVGYRMVEGD